MSRAWSQRAEPQTVHTLPRTPYAELDAASLSRKLKAADPQAAAELWERYSVRVRALIRRTLGACDEVDDLVQDVFVAAFKDVHRLRDDHALQGFVLGIATHVLRSALRQRGRRKMVELSEADHPTTSPNPEAQRALRRLQALLETLSPDLRLVFVLRHVEQLELTQVAEAMKWSLATTKRRLARARGLVFERAQRDALLCAFLAEGDEP
ncbi:MAG: hypothetical protein AUK47_08475 [Deltaproteobacteria bacterium CG2_30_63_29]|nr:MAG: hypothetical protein AUK47_08475 [Deltaproteobacteria bacterium CG2_30_63_29]